MLYLSVLGLTFLVLNSNALTAKVLSLSMYCLMRHSTQIVISTKVVNLNTNKFLTPFGYHIEIKWQVFKTSSTTSIVYKVQNTINDHFLVYHRNNKLFNNMINIIHIVLLGLLTRLMLVTVCTVLTTTLSHRETL